MSKHQVAISAKEDGGTANWLENLPTSEMILAASQASYIHLVFRTERNLADSEIANPRETGLKNACAPIGLNDQKKREKSGRLRKIVSFPLKHGEENARHVGDRCIVTRSERTRSRSRARAQSRTKRAERAPQSAAGPHVTRSGHTNEVRSHRSSRTHRRSRVSALPFPPSGSFQPVGWTRTVDCSHASATRLRAVQKPPSCTLCACRSEVVSYNMHAHTRLSITIETSPSSRCDVTCIANYLYFFVSTTSYRLQYYNIRV